jgi:hypothetical protein
VKSGPEVSLVGMAVAESRDRKRLTWYAPRPDGTVVAPSGAAEGIVPDPDPGEEVALGVASEVVGGNIEY